MDMKLIFLDIDGTLTLPGTSVPPDSALEAIRIAQARGHKVFLSTGRDMDMLSPLLKYGFDGVVASAGGYIEYGGQVLYDHPMTDAQRDIALERFKAGGVFRTIEAKDGTFGDDDLSLFPSTSWNSEHLRWRVALEQGLGVRPMGEYDGRPIYKVVFMCRTLDQLIPAREALEKDFHFCIQSRPGEEGVNGEMINRAFDKGKGVLRVCEHLGVDVSHTYCFGDSMNDYEMIRTAGTGVVMANGAEALKAIADYVCPSVEEDGLAKAFRELGLI